MEIIFLIILIIAGLGAHFISGEVKRMLMDKANWIATFFSILSFFMSAAVIGCALIYGLVAFGVMCGGM